MAGLLVYVRPAAAHHAFAAEFDAKEAVRLQGVVSKVEWVNPHAWIHIDVKKPDGTVEKWMIEGGTPNTLFRRGITENFAAVWNHHCGGWLSGQGRFVARQWPQT